MPPNRAQLRQLPSCPATRSTGPSVDYIESVTTRASGIYVGRKFPGSEPGGRHTSAGSICELAPWADQNCTPSGEEQRRPRIGFSFGDTNLKLTRSCRRLTEYGRSVTTLGGQLPGTG